MSAQTPGPGPGSETVLGTAEETRELGRSLAGRLRAGDLVLLTGELGAGKTTFTQGLAQGLGVRGPITSPTFVIARVHPSLVGGPVLVHADAYRLQGALDLEALDLDADLDRAVTVVEWGRGLAEDLSDDYLEVELTRRVGEGDERGDDADVRTARLVGHGSRWA